MDNGPGTVDNNTGSTGENILSTTDGETAFFRSIIRYRPRGYNRHFAMLGMCKDLEKELQVVIPSSRIWNALRSCYNVDLLAEMEPDDADEIDRSKSTIELLNAKQALFQEFQLPVHPSTPAEVSFLDLVNARRLETASNPSSPDQANIPVVHSPRSRRTTINSSSKLHLDQRNTSTNKLQNKHHPVDTSNKSAPDHRLGEEGMESDLTEQEDYDDDDDDDDDDDNQKDKDDDNEEEELTPERLSQICLTVIIAQVFICKSKEAKRNCLNPNIYIGFSKKNEV